MATAEIRPLIKTVEPPWIGRVDMIPSLHLAGHHLSLPGAFWGIFEERIDFQ